MLSSQYLKRDNTRIYNLSSGPDITRILEVVAKKLEKCRSNLCFETSEHNVQTACDNSKVSSQATSFSNNFSIIYFQIGILF